MATPPVIIADFHNFGASFSWDAYQAMIPPELTKDEYLATNDPAIRDAWWEASRQLILEQGVTKKHWDEARIAATEFVCEGYAIARYIFGTYRLRVSYTTTKADARDARDTMMNLSRTYEERDIEGALNPELRAALSGMAGSEDSYLCKQLHEQGRNVNLTMLFAGLRLGLAEEFLFSLRRHVGLMVL